MKKGSSYAFQNYNMPWDKWYEKFDALGREMKALKVTNELDRYVPEEVIPYPEGLHTGI